MYGLFSYFIVLFQFSLIVFHVELPVGNSLLQYNFVGRLLGPRGNSLKRVEASTECRVLIRGRGSIKDPVKVFLLYISTNMVVFLGCFQKY